MKKRIFSGIQPTGNIHIGNYLGAIHHWVESQEEFDNIFCIVDLHAITLPQDPKELKSHITEVAGLLFACGVDPKLSTVFIQSHVPAHTELTWILNCFIPMGWMRRMTQFKDKSNKQKENVSVGLFDYPALMAADILLYDTDYVPVGADQKQHVELTRDVAQRFNNIYGHTFKIPEAIIPQTGARIMGLDDPIKKMSKSSQNKNHAIYLLDSPEIIRDKIAKATTDSKKDIRFDKKRPGIYNLLNIYELFTNKKRKEIETKYEGKGYADFKEDLAEIIIKGLKPVQDRYKELTSDPNRIDSLLDEGANRIEPLADKLLSKVKKKVGLV